MNAVMTKVAGAAICASVTEKPHSLRLELDGAALVANWRWLRERSGVTCGAAVKADGYGLGARAVVARLAAAGARDFYVATWGEAAALGVLPEGVRLSVLHGVRAEDMDAARASPARPVLNSAAQVARWREAGGGACDVMVDTGMNRLGLSPEEACSGLLDGVAIETLMSHLACADEPAHPLNARQSAAFGAVAARVPAARTSLANSAGILLGDAYAFDLVRPGIALYGGRQVPAMAPIRPVVRLAAQVLQRRKVEAGGTIGYGAIFAAPRDMAVAIVNLGYADGYYHSFTGHGVARAAGRNLPLLGRVSMDLTAFDVTDVDVGEGDWLTIDHDLPQAATTTGMSQYELLTGLGARFERRWTN